MDTAIEFIRSHESQVVQHLRSDNERLQQTVDMQNLQITNQKRMLDLFEARIHELDDQLHAMSYEKDELVSKLEKVKRKRKMERWIDQTMEEYNKIERDAADAWLGEENKMKRRRHEFRG